MDRVENVMEGRASHALGKCPMVQEKGESSTKETHVGEDLQYLLKGEFPFIN